MPPSIPARSPSEVFAVQLEETRRRKGWTQADLAAELARLGYPIDRTTVAKLEKSKRGVTLDEVFAFAVALGVSPSALLLPRGNEWVAITPRRRATSWGVWQWFRGLEQLPGTHDEDEEVLFYGQRPNVEAIAFGRVPWLAQQLGAVYHLVRIAAGDDEYAKNVERAAGRTDLANVVTKTLELNEQTAQKKG